MDSHLDVVRRIFDGWSRGDFRAGAEHLDEHVLFYVPPEFPEFGVFVGPRGVGEYMRRLLDQWERLTIAADRLQPVGDTVLARVSQHGKGRSSGIEVDDSYFMLLTFRGGRIMRIETIRDEDDALAAVGLDRAPAESANVALARSIYAAWERGDFTETHWADPELELVRADGLDPGTYSGIEGMAEAWGEWLRAWDEFRVKAESYRELDGERVLVIAQFSGRGKTSGLDVGATGTTGASLFHVRNGKVVRLVLYTDRKRALDDAALTDADVGAGA